MLCYVMLCYVMLCYVTLCLKNICIIQELHKVFVLALSNCFYYILDGERKVEYSKPTENQNKENILLKAVNNPVFIPRSFQEPATYFAPTSSSILPSAVNAPEFVPGETFLRHEESPEETALIIEFVNNKIQQLTEDPGLLDELSVSMANYLSACITVENEMILISGILFEKVGNDLNYQVIKKWSPLIQQGIVMLCKLYSFMQKYCLDRRQET